MGQANLLDAGLMSHDGQAARIRVGDAFELFVPAARWPSGLVQTRVSIRPEKVHLSKTPLGGENTFAARVDEEVFRGATDRFALTAAGRLKLTAIAANESALRAAIHAGDHVWCAVHGDDVVVVPK